MEIEPTKIEGMVPYRTIKSDFYMFDEEHYRAVGRRTHHSLRLGDPVRIRVTGTSLEQKLLDYELVENLPSADLPADLPAETDNPEADMERAMAVRERRPRRRKK